MNRFLPQINSVRQTNRLFSRSIRCLSQLHELLRSLDEPELFWDKAASDIVWTRKYSEVLSKQTIGSSKTPWYSWFEGGELNTCFNMLDRHILEGKGENPAIIYESPITNSSSVSFTYNQLLQEVEAVSALLEDCGLEKGDRCLVYMPMVPESLFTMMACARLGAVHSVVFGGFAAPELAKRIRDCEPKVIVTASCGLETKKIVSYQPMLSKAIELSGFTPEVIVHKERNITEFKGDPIVKSDLSVHCRRFEDYHSSIDRFKRSRISVPCRSVGSSEPLYLLYTSGTTGKPKGVQRDNGGHAVALKYAMKHVMDMNPGEVYFCASDIGWAVGHTFILYAPLLHGCATVLMEGKPVGTPDAGSFWRIVEKHHAKTMFTAPTALRAIMKQDYHGDMLSSVDTSSLKSLFIAGERCDPSTLQWIQKMFPNTNIIDNWWQTETGWPITAASPYFGTPIRFGSGGQCVPGYDIRVLNSDTESPTELNPGEFGDIVIKLPMPPGCLSTLWNNDDGMVESYLSRFPGYYHSGDAGWIDDEKYVHIMSRVDDIINIAGHRLSTGGMEQIVAKHPHVAECAVIALDDAMKGEVPVGLVVLKDAIEEDKESLEKELRKMIRDEIGAIAILGDVIVVSQLPKTRSGKILRGILRKIGNGKEYTVPGTIEDESVLEEMHKVLDPHH